MATHSVSENFDAWPELASLDRQLDGSVDDIGRYRATLERGRRRLVERFRNNDTIEPLVRDLALLVDGILLRVWRNSAGEQFGKMALIAVGGYGRGELHPGSDIDVMLLVGRKRINADDRAGIEQFLTMLWDVGLEVGHSVRTLKECVRAAKEDITVATSLMESRLLHGDAELFTKMRKKTGPESIWPSNKFFEAKLQEQTARHARYHDTASNLEPNLKGSPGGLRDIQMVGWVAKRHFGADTLRELVSTDFLSAHEYLTISQDRAFLWKIRFALHTLTGRREDRLLFDHQARLAEEFGYQDKPHSLGVEQLMQKYYRTAIRVTRLNEMLLQLFREAILINKNEPSKRINDDLQIVNNNLDVIDSQLFERRPNALMELFAVIHEHVEITGVSARTIRLIRQKRDLIDDRFRNDPENFKTFLKILRAPIGVTHVLRRMNVYGILARYIPEFGKIVGLMQYDLFHAYTVDAHTLFVVSNLRRFALSRFNHEFPYCSQIMQSLPKPELVYLAGLFHDIAKGRGGDHSELGAEVAENFCLRLGVGTYDARLVSWLVRNHLILSTTAQKKDINDPQVIHEFSTLVRDDLHLKYLYVLTVADVRGTNPKLWNSWKASLFERLYRQTRRALDRGLENPIDREELITETREQAAALLHAVGIDDNQRLRAWENFDETYFLRHSPSEICWHTEVLIRHIRQHDAVVAVRNLSSADGGSMMVLAPRAVDTFSRVTAVLEQQGLTILDARVTNVAHDYSLDSYRILGVSESAHDEERRAERLEAAILRAFASRHVPKVTRSAPRQTKIFSTPTVVEFASDPNNRQTIMELIAADQPGLLSRVGQAFVECDVLVTAAKIVTIGERAEDVFYLTDNQGALLSAETCTVLQEKIMESLPSAT
ncbi:MAG: [protein-PII] uridylyltransferase [Gammaproteobacteria bacterium]|nr:[protein-PII] uridylyltransferase [Gammaproteobacteria bacterium]